MALSKELLDELLNGCEQPGDLLSESGLKKELKIRLVEQMPGAELTKYSGYEEGKVAPADQPNRRNGSPSNVLKGQGGALPISVPLDRDGSFEPQAKLSVPARSIVSRLIWRRTRGCNAGGERKMRR